MAINVGDHNIAKNIIFDNIRVERIEEGQFFHIRVMNNEKYNTGSGRGVQNIIFRNIYYTGKNDNSALIEEDDFQRKISDILFENINVNDKRIKSLDELNIKMGNFTDNIKLK